MTWTSVCDLCEKPVEACDTPESVSLCSDPEGDLSIRAGIASPANKHICKWCFKIISEHTIKDYKLHRRITNDT
jgi:hypothetical protein